MTEPFKQEIEFGPRRAPIEEALAKAKKAEVSLRAKESRIERVRETIAAGREAISLAKTIFWMVAIIFGVYMLVGPGFTSLIETIIGLQWWWWIGAIFILLLVLRRR